MPAHWNALCKDLLHARHWCIAILGSNVSGGSREVATESGVGFHVWLFKMIALLDLKCACASLDYSLLYVAAS